MTSHSNARAPVTLGLVARQQLDKYGQRILSTLLEETRLEEARAPNSSTAIEKELHLQYELDAELVHREYFRRQAEEWTRTRTTTFDWADCRMLEAKVDGELDELGLHDEFAIHGEVELLNLRVNLSPHFAQDWSNGLYYALQYELGLVEKRRQCAGKLSQMPEQRAEEQRTLCILQARLRARFLLRSPKDREEAMSSYVEVKREVDAMTPTQRRDFFSTRLTDSYRLFKTGSGASTRSDLFDHYLGENPSVPTSSRGGRH